MSQSLIEVSNLHKAFPVNKQLLKKPDWLKAVRGVDFSVTTGETYGLVGESGCGKSTVSKLLLRLLEPDTGEVSFQGQNILSLSKAKMKQIRRQMQIVFQDPYASLDPKWKIGSIIGEPLKIHGIGTKEERRKKVKELMELTDLRPEFMERYAHEFSGGQRQRIGIARALALDPKIIIADEPVSALDVSIQAQIINLFKRLQRELGLGYIFIAHDLSVVRHISDRVGVMYLGQIVEEAPTQKLFKDAKHPYTSGLISTIPLPDPTKRKELELVEGEVPSPINPPAGCGFHPRCPYTKSECKENPPPKVQIDNNHMVRCHLYAE
ncbi:ABC transporter ATP-binding protein [Natranaerobius thermophilus]|uniref:Oligopeptide/dipeptide ABC transporter, ATPase subunit n=1 Tax=Natranaerobius thermophilus (strain ATCC BAA-1301 / DSM 18059 / JW/NM-WN-LF) TaxID=457570 RepID=B2A293_NATTJ|nr:oligopeptide/dipeptide ABC transporter ATP-binding protein [Natranaerobius thermophilus]ACB86199.1 oligopeptide/dipeptide ABC transporter, ATPase subunit [Natranaerobius thermophilus JW/NM-WN-LF]